MTLRFLLLPHHYHWLFWGLGALICVGAGGLAYFSSYFSYDYAVRDMPVLQLVGGLFLIGLFFVALRFCVGGMASHRGRSIGFIAGLFIVGLLARLLLMVSEPVLEDDYQRYLWDGGLVASGLNPYKYSPDDVLNERAPYSHELLADQAYPLLERINHPKLRTIYPIGSQIFFGTAHKISGFSLLGWRSLLLIAEILSFTALFLMVRHFKRDEIWLSLYWWNPLVIKELINSAHMEGVLLPFLLFGVYASFRGKFFIASGALSLAASIKLWPALLLPLIWRRMLTHKLMLLGAIVLSLIIGLAILWPFATSGLNESSGLVAYGLKWKTNSAFFPAFETYLFWLATFTGYSWLPVPLIARVLIGAGLVGVVLWLTSRPLKSDNQHLSHLFITTLLIFLFSPAQFPWYFVWIAPFLVFFPLWGLIVLVPFMALYYAGFALMNMDEYSHYRPWLALIVWMPAWALLFWEGHAIWRSRSCDTKNSSAL